jgi:hypothetical protein
MFVSNDANRLVSGVPMHEGDPDEQALREAARRTLLGQYPELGARTSAYSSTPGGRGRPNG